MLLDDIEDGPSDGLRLLRWGFELYGFHLRFWFPRNTPYRCPKHDATFCFPKPKSQFAIIYKDTPLPPNKAKCLSRALIFAWV